MFLLKVHNVIVNIVQSQRENIILLHYTINALIINIESKLEGSEITTSILFNVIDNFKYMSSVTK